MSHVAQVPFVREWMKERQRSCVQFGNLVMEGRDITSNIFPDTPHKFYLDASAEVRQARRDADGVEENLAARDQRDSTRKAAPLKVVEGATVINNSGESPEETSAGSLRWCRAASFGQSHPPASGHLLSIRALSPRTRSPAMAGPS